MDQVPLWLVVVAVSRDALILLAVLLSTRHGKPRDDQALSWCLEGKHGCADRCWRRLILADLAFAIDVDLATLPLVAWLSLAS
jgi:hypothetical protein